MDGGGTLCGTTQGPLSGHCGNILGAAGPACALFATEQPLHTHASVPGTARPNGGPEPRSRALTEPFPAVARLRCKRSVTFEGVWFQQICNLSGCIMNDSLLFGAPDRRPEEAAPLRLAADRLAFLTMVPCLRPSRTLRAAFGGGLRQFLTGAEPGIDGIVRPGRRNGARPDRDTLAAARAADLACPSRQRGG